jgi:outer membrane lipoprotein SlyB
MNMRLHIGALLLVGLAGSCFAQTNSGRVLIKSDAIYTRCDRCGVVQDIEHTITQGKKSSGAGTIAGAVVGGVVGNQIGKGNGRKLATVGGAIGGGAVGNSLATRGGESWTIRVKMGNGTITNVVVADATSLRVGDVVEIDRSGNVSRL